MNSTQSTNIMLSPLASSKSKTLASTITNCLDSGREYHSSFKKRVRFDKKPPAIIENLIHGDVDTEPRIDNDEAKKTDLWYSLSELKLFKVACAQLAKMIAKHDRSVSDKYSYHRVVIRVWVATMNDHEQVSEGLLTLFSKCVRLSPSRLGLERQTIPKIQNDVAKRRAALIAHVHSIQAMKGMSAREKEIELQKRCEQVSAPSRLFARQLATGLCSDIKTMAEPSRNTNRSTDVLESSCVEL